MSTILGLLPLLVLLALTASVIRAVVLLALRPMHPRRILVTALGAASILALIGLAGVLPSAAWWAVWLLALALVASLVPACRRALTPTDAEDLPPRRRRLLEAPSRAALLGEAVLVLVLLALAVYAG